MDRYTLFSEARKALKSFLHNHGLMRGKNSYHEDDNNFYVEGSTWFRAQVHAWVEGYGACLGEIVASEGE